jgi:hypothetical protein
LLLGHSAGPERPAALKKRSPLLERPVKLAAAQLLTDFNAVTASYAAEMTDFPEGYGA